MGYDMYFRGKTYADGDESYFRLSIFSMSRYCQHMAERGMIFDAGPYPPFPDGGDWDKIDQFRYPEFYQDSAPLTEEEIQAAKEHLAATDEVLSWHGPEIPGIPGHKFGSNDGWIVTPAECEAAYRIGKDKPAPDGEEKWAQWLDYLHRAAAHGGFEVK